MCRSDAMQRAVDELFAKPTVINLFSQSPNALEGGADDHSDGYLPDTSRSSTLTMNMMRFVGQIAGISFRTKVTHAAGSLCVRTGAQSYEVVLSLVHQIGLM